MKKIIRILFSPVLNYFESGTEAYEYKSSHRTILLTIGVLFSGLAAVVFWLARGADAGYLFPVIIFAATGLVSFIIGYAGSDRAVAKIWGSR